MTDGCSGFWWLESIFTGIRACCDAHDLGSSDGTLLDCLLAALPPWAWAPAAGCVALMILLRPLYQRLKRFFKRG